MKTINVAILGFGGIAQSHLAGYERLKKENFPVKLVALCDIDPARFDHVMKKGDEYTVYGQHVYTDLDTMLANEEIDTVDICLPTYLHKEYAIRCMQAGKHVQSEKPMALSSADCAEMIRVAEECGKHFMIGQCLRFNANYLAVKDIIDSGKYGRVLCTGMKRFSALPRWGYDKWFPDYTRSGGEMLDMSIHDYDMARFLYGEPDYVSAFCVNYELPEQASSVRLQYADGSFVSVEGSWAEGDTSPFTCGIHVTLEKASVYWDGTMKYVRVCPSGAPAYNIDLPDVDHMAEEIRFFAKVVAGEMTNEKNTPASAMKTVVLIEKLRESCHANGAVLPF